MTIQDYLTYAKSMLTGGSFSQTKPERIQFPVNDICNAHCVMCNIWHKKRDIEISPEDLALILKDPLFSEVKAVGLNGGEPTLRKDLAILAHVLAEGLPKLRSLSLITNGLKRERARESIQKLAEVCKKTGKVLNVMVSLDGVGALHDFVRGREGNFVNADGLIGDLKEMGISGTIQIGCTVVKQNVYGLHELLDYALEKGVYIKYRLGVPHRRLYKPATDGPLNHGRISWPDLQPFALSFEQTVHFAEFLLNLNKHYETSPAQQWFYRSLVDQIVTGKARQAGCAWRYSGITLTSKHELAYCAVESDVLGDLTKESASALYWGKSDHLEEIKSQKCATCMHDYGGMPEGQALRQYAKERIAKSLRAKRVTQIIFDGAIGRDLKSARARQAAEHIIDRLKNTKFEGRLPANGASIPKVVICGWYGTETAGDKAILGGVMMALRHALGDIDITVASLYPHITELTRLQMPELGRFHVASIDDAAALIDEAALLVFGGGPIMAIPRIAVMLGLVERASARGVPVVVAGCGVGPLGSDLNNSHIRRLLELAAIRVYRDSESRDAAAGLGIDTSLDEVAEDPAFTWLESATRGAHPDRAPRRLLLGLRDWPFTDYGRGLAPEEAQAIKKAFDAGMVEVLDQVRRDMPDLEIAPLPMCANSYGGDDRNYYIETLCRKASLRGAIDFSLLGRELTPAQYVEQFKKSTFAVSMRFHSLVFAIATDTPCITVDYTLGKGKVSALANRHQIDQFSIAKVDWDQMHHRLIAGLGSSTRPSPPVTALRFTQAIARTIEHTMRRVPVEP